MQMKFNSKIRESATLLAVLAIVTWGGTSAHAAVEGSAPEAFKTMDVDGDGFVTAKEAISGKIATETFVAADRDHDDKLDRYEYMAAGLDKSEAKPQ